MAGLPAGMRAIQTGSLPARMSDCQLYGRDDLLHFCNMSNALRWSRRYGGAVYVRDEADHRYHHDWIVTRRSTGGGGGGVAFVVGSIGDWTEEMYDGYAAITGKDLRSGSRAWPRMGYTDDYVPDPVGDSPPDHVERMADIEGYETADMAERRPPGFWRGPEDVNSEHVRAMYSGGSDRTPARDPSFLWFAARFGMSRMLGLDWQPCNGEFPDSMALDFVEIEGANDSLSNYADNLTDAVAVYAARRGLPARSARRFILMPDGSIIRAGKNTDRIFGGAWRMASMNVRALARARREFGVSNTWIAENQTRMTVVDLDGDIRVNRTPTRPQMETLRRLVRETGADRQSFRDALVATDSVRDALPTRRLQYAYLNAYASAVFAPRDGLPLQDAAEACPAGGPAP